MGVWCSGPLNTITNQKCNSQSENITANLRIHNSKTKIRLQIWKWSLRLLKKKKKKIRQSAIFHFPSWCMGGFFTLVSFYFFYLQQRCIEDLLNHSSSLWWPPCLLKREIFSSNFMANINILHLYTQIMINMTYSTWIRSILGIRRSYRLLLPELLDTAWPPRGRSFTSHIIPHSSPNPWWLDGPCVSHISHFHPAISHDLIARLLPI